MGAPSFSVVVETENLALGGSSDLERCLNSLERQTVDIGSANEVLLMVGGHLDPADAVAIGQRYPWIKIQVAGEELSYLAAKREGARLSTGAYVFCADSDMEYIPNWIELLLNEVSKHPSGTIICSDTRVPLDSAYGVALQVVWMLPVLRSGGPVQPVKAFRLNNFVVDRETMASSQFGEGLPLYRGSFGFWRKRMRRGGIRFYRVRQVTGLHLAPKGAAEWFHRMLIFGGDYVATANFRLCADGRFEQRSDFLRRLWFAAKWISYRWVMSVVQSVWLLTEQPRLIRFVPLGIPIGVASLVVISAGSLITVFHSRFVYDRMVAFENSS